MEEFNKIQVSGHDSIAGMIEKCARTSLKMYNEMDADEEDADGENVENFSDTDDTEDSEEDEGTPEDEGMDKIEITEV